MAQRLVLLLVEPLLVHPALLEAPPLLVRIWMHHPYTLSSTFAVQDLAWPKICIHDICQKLTNVQVSQYDSQRSPTWREKLKLRHLWSGASSSWGSAFSTGPNYEILQLFFTHVDEWGARSSKKFYLLSNSSHTQSSF